MGMGTYGLFADAIKYENLKELCKPELATLETLLDKYGVSFGALARAVYFDDEDAIDEACLDALLEVDIQGDELDLETQKRKREIKDAWAALQESFNQKTNLHLDLSCYNENEGDRYDDAHYAEDGAFFTVDGVWTKTPAGEKWAKIVTQIRWTQFG